MAGDSLVVLVPVLRVRVGITTGFEGVAAIGEDSQAGLPVPDVLSFFFGAFGERSLTAVATPSFSFVPEGYAGFEERNWYERGTIMAV